ncbi:MAG: 3-phosphoshikimate 1-carboxyvinyltransferase [Pyrinomonadaceae bacterium]
MKLSKAMRVAGIVVLPGDKSISHRAAMLAAMADGTSRIENFASSEDCSSTLNCLSALGVRIETSGAAVTVIGAAKNGWRPPERPLDCGNSGTTMRLMAGLLAGQPFSSTLVGDASLSGRPMKRIIGPLTEMGASVESDDGHAPLRISGRKPLLPIEFTLPVASAQLKSSILLAGLLADGDTSVIEPIPTRDHTERMLRAFGVDVRVDEVAGGRRITVPGGSQLEACDFRVPSDVSSASFFMVAAACLEGSRIEMPGVGLNPTRTGIIEVLRRFGVDMQISDEGGSDGEPVGTLTVRGTERPNAAGPRIDGKIVANVIDEIPILAVLGTQAVSGIEIRDAKELRVKESDRISAVVENLRRMGADVEEFEDGLRVGPSDLRGAVVDSFGDHRIAMAFSVAALFAEGETEIVDAGCAAVSYPAFYRTLGSTIIAR